MFFGGTTIATLATVIAGFGPTYFFSSVSSSAVELTPALHVHGAVFTTWMLLLVVQSTLISAGRVDIHRQLGVAGAVLGAFMMLLGAYVVISRLRAGLLTAPPGAVASRNRFLRSVAKLRHLARKLTCRASVAVRRPERE
jgi:hypothetical protein